MGALCSSELDPEKSLTYSDERDPPAPEPSTSRSKRSPPASVSSGGSSPNTKLSVAAKGSEPSTPMSPPTEPSDQRQSTFRTLSQRFGLANTQMDVGDLREEYPFVPAGHIVKNISKFLSLDTEQLGDGASCRVVRATPKADLVSGGGRLKHKPYALKIMSREDKYNPLLFKQEARILELLKGHSNIIHFEDAFIDRKNFYIITTLLTGGELFDRVKTEKKFAEPMAIEMVRHILSAIVYCHERNIVHRDLKPENIVFKNREYRAEDLVIIDFGDAEEITDDSVHENFIGMDILKETISRICLLFSDFDWDGNCHSGSPFYISPESIRPRKGWELKRSDVWSIGVITYILLTGRPPFWAHANKQIIKKIVKSEVRFPQAEPLSDLAKDFILKLLTKEPAMRPTAKEALNHAWLNQDDRSSDADRSEEAKESRSLAVGSSRSISGVSSGASSVKSSPSKGRDSERRRKEEAMKAAEKKREMEKRRLEAFMENERILRDLASYHSSTKMKRLIIKTVASNLDASHREQYKMQFAPFDLKGDERIDRDELRDFLINCGISKEEATIRAAHITWAIMGHIDRRITPDHWIYAQMGKLLAPTHICERQFEHLDIDGDKKITASDLLQMFDGITTEQANDMIGEADADGDGVINFSDFSKLMAFDPAYRPDGMSESMRSKLKEMLKRSEMKKSSKERTSSGTGTRTGSTTKSPSRPAGKSRTTSGDAGGRSSSGQALLAPKPSPDAAPDELASPSSAMPSSETVGSSHI